MNDKLKIAFPIPEGGCWTAIFSHHIGNNKVYDPIFEVKVDYNLYGDNKGCGPDIISIEYSLN